ncbi:hypothetical protein BDZ91DRAFT_789726 [Kalaharituber pfeilii]|nr:hypothetical protein BDZ91DRAFT_789726 [Kalaharituber pfeilii]
MNTNTDVDVYISVASIGMVLYINRRAQDMNEHQQRLSPAPASEMGNGVLNTPPAAGELDSAQIVVNHTARESELLSGDHDNRSNNTRTDFPPLLTVLRRTHGDHVELAPQIFHEMPALQTPAGHHRTPGHIPSTYGAASTSPNQSVTRNIVRQQDPGAVELEGMGTTQAFRNAPPLIELPGETDSEDTELQLPTPGSILRGTARISTQKSKRKSWYRKLQDFIQRRESRK